MLDMSSRLSKEQSSQYYTSYLYHVFGSQTGEAYVNSLQRFVEGMDARVLSYVNSVCSNVTLGGFRIAQQVEELVSQQLKSATDMPKNADPVKEAPNEDDALDGFLHKLHGLTNPALYP
jgi:hypothetical protein